MGLLHPRYVDPTRLPRVLTVSHQKRVVTRILSIIRLLKPWPVTSLPHLFIFPHNVVATI